MMRYHLPTLPKDKARVAQLQGKKIFLKSLSPPLAQVIKEGRRAAELRIVREPLFSTELILAAGSTRLDFFNYAINGVSTNGIAATEEDTNMSTANQIGEPEVNYEGLVTLLYAGTSEHPATPAVYHRAKGNSGSVRTIRREAVVGPSETTRRARRLAA